MKIKVLIHIFASIAINLAFVSCGDIFRREKLIVAPYYLVESDKYEGMSIGYKLENGDYIGRVPGAVVEYGVTDSFLVAKTQQNDSNRYFIINRKNDSELSEKEEFLSGPFTEEEFNDSWRRKLNIRLIKVNY